MVRRSLLVTLVCAVTGVVGAWAVAPTRATALILDWGIRRLDVASVRATLERRPAPNEDSLTSLIYCPIPGRRPGENEGMPPRMNETESRDTPVASDSPDDRSLVERAARSSTCNPPPSSRKAAAHQ